MKQIKLVFTLLLLLFTANASAQKSYVEIVENASSYSIYGDVPANLNIKEINNTVYNKWGEDTYSYATVPSGFSILADIINALSKEGYTVEYYQTVPHGSENKSSDARVLMSRNSYSANSIQHIESDYEDEGNGEIREVARYNLQGMPIGKNEKGIQIIVYSNYTTKTVIVE